MAPNEFAWQWEDRIHEFTDSNVTYITAADKALRSYHPTSLGYDIVPYSLFRTDFSTIIKRRWDVFITDEAQLYSNPGTKLRKSLLAYNRTHDPIYRWALTGTAVPDRLEQLYMILYWVQPRFLPNWGVFAENHIVQDSFGRIVKYKNINELNKFIQARVDRKTHADFKGQMPPIVPKTYKIPKSKDYERTEAKLLQHLDESAKSISFDEDGDIRGLRNPRVSREFSRTRQRLLPPKIKFAYDLTKAILDENDENKVVIFCFYKEPLRQLLKLCENGGLDAVKFTGDELGVQKRAAADAFRNRARVLLSSDAGARGLDLPHANYVIHLDVPFSWEVLDQRNKRITRASSKWKTVVVNYIIMEDSIEDYYYQVVMNKGRLAKATLEGGLDEVVIKTKSLRQFLRR